MLKSSAVRCALWLLCSRVQAAGSGFWIVPNGNDNDLTQAFPANTPLDLAWSGQPALATFTTFDSATTEADLFSLFVTGFQPGGSFVQLITAGINLTSAGTYRWNTSIPASELAITQQYVLRFIIETNNVNGFPSPGFLIQGGTPTTTSSSSVPSSSASTPTTASPQSSTTGTGAPPASRPRGLSTGVKVAVGVVIPVVILALLVGAYYYFRRHTTPLQAEGPEVAEVQTYQYTPTAELAVGRPNDRNRGGMPPRSSAQGQHELPI